MNLEDLKKEYATQDNRATAYPIYVWVQTLQHTCYFKLEDDEPRGYYDFEETIITDDGEKLMARYRYVPEELFLTVKGAEEYIKANKHNLHRPRTWVGHFNRRNFEMRALLKELGFRTED